VRSQPLTPKDLRRGLLVKAPTVAGLLESLVKGGLVTRRPDASGRRPVLVELTRKAPISSPPSGRQFAVPRACPECLTEAER
jgi:hypothetical protein